MPKIEFTAKLVPAEGWVCLNFPKSASKRLRSVSRVPVTGTINGFPFRTSAFPKEGTHFLLVNKDMQRIANVGAGDRVKVVLKVDTKPRIIELPPELKKALSKSPAAKKAFDRLSYSHKREYVRWIEAARKEETRSRRIEEAIEMLSKGTKTPA